MGIITGGDDVTARSTVEVVLGLQLIGDMPVLGMGALCATALIMLRHPWREAPAQRIKSERRSDLRVHDGREMPIASATIRSSGPDRQVRARAPQLAALTSDTGSQPRPWLEPGA